MGYKDKYKNNSTKKFFANLPTDLVERTPLASFVKFNFKYLDVSREEEGFCSFLTLSDDQKKLIFEKIKEFSGNSKYHWECVAKLGKHHVLEKYTDDVLKEKCPPLPKHVPVDVEWYRWRLQWDFRLVGFFLAKGRWREEVKIGGDSYFLDPNAFYLVYIDPQHKFYNSSKK